MQSIKNLKITKGDRILIRTDYNVPMKAEAKGSKILDARRIEASYQSLDLIVKKGGVAIVLAHLGKGTESLRPVATLLSKRYPKMAFVDRDIMDPELPEIVRVVPPGTVVLLENIRRTSDEEDNTKAFAKALSRLGTAYINDAFSVSHRAHASVVGIPKLIPGYAGFQLEAEIKALSPVIEKPKHPFVFLLGGAKFATKVPLIKRFIETADSVVITGAILNVFYKVAGFPVGKSVVDEGYDAVIAKLLKNPKLLLPIDVIVERGEKAIAITPEEVEANDVIVDIGPRSIKMIIDKLSKAKLVVWNGPTGWYEKGHTKGTVAIAKSITTGTVQAVIGGGDTGVVVEKALAKGTNKKVFVSTGGGAALDYLSAGTLPGIAILK